MTTQPDPPDLHLAITSDKANPFDPQWKDECRNLYLEIALNLEEGAVSPAPKPPVAGKRGLPPDFLGNLILTGVNLGVFTGIFNLLKLWLENRKTCEVTIAYPDGFTMKVSKISLKEALELHEKHAKPKGSGILLP